MSHAVDILAHQRQDTELPVATLRQAIPYLRRPFTPDAVRWKVATQWPKDEPRAGQVVAYIDARLVVERLNLVVAELWHDEYERMSEGLLCRLTIDGVTRRDVGDGKGKASYSDSLKRAAVHFGVGVSLYALPAVKMNAGPDEGQLPVRGPQGKRTLRIEPNQLTWLRDRYAMWLDTIGREAFGEPLDHGDVLGSQGDPDVPEPEPGEAEPHLFEDDAPPKPTGRRISKERAQAIAAKAAAASISASAICEHLGLTVNGGDPVEVASEGLKLLKGSQADEVEAWIGAGT